MYLVNFVSHAELSSSQAFQQVEDWLPPLDGEEPDELRAVEEEVDGEDDDDEETESKGWPPAVIPGRKTRLQEQKEKEATKVGHEEAASLGQSSSEDVEEVTPSKLGWRKSPSRWR
jgi:hypothetical protein